MNALKELIGRVEQGSGPDYELERDIGFALGIWKLAEFEGFDMIEAGRQIFPDHPGSIHPALLEQIDAVLSLIEAKLPGWGHCYATGWDADGNCGGFVSPERTVDLTKATLGTASSPARALLAALLRALQENRP